METVLSIKGITKSFGALKAVNRVSIDVGDRQLYSVIGPNGAGKTTFFNCISGTFRPEEGKVFLQGQDITGWPNHQLVRAGLVRTFQITSVFPGLKVRENVELALRSLNGHNLDIFHSSRMPRIEQVAVDILELVGLGERAGNFASEIGHGDRRVLEIAIALALQPRVLLLDEPTQGMSATETERLSRLIRRLTERTTVLLIEHNMDVVLAISDKILVLVLGRVLAEGTPAEICANAKVQAAYLGETEVT
jgi:branched-chain amino acid transport system ATP-binding protein